MRLFLIFLVMALVGCEKEITPYTAINQFGSSHSEVEGLFFNSDTTEVISIFKNQETKFIRFEYFKNNGLAFKTDTFYYDVDLSRWFLNREGLNITLDVNWQNDFFIIEGQNQTTVFSLGEKFTLSQQP